MFRLRIVALAAVLCGQISAGATTYEPVTFDDLVTRADVIFVGEVTDVRPFPLETPDGRSIKTRVIFRVSDPIWGTTNLLEVFDFLGGVWGDVELAVAGMPEFAVGDRRVVFASREPSINPIVGFTQGLLQIRRDSDGVDRVFTLGGLPLGRPESIGVMVPAAPVAPVAPSPPSRLCASPSSATASAGSWQKHKDSEESEGASGAACRSERPVVAQSAWQRLFAAWRPVARKHRHAPSTGFVIGRPY